MLNTELYKNSRLYNFFMKSLGYEASLKRFLNEIALEYSGDIQILDAGCGTGILGLSLIQRLPSARLLATDLEPNFLEATRENALRLKITQERFQLGISNINQPEQVATLDQQALNLSAESVDIICVGAVVGYAQNPDDCIQRLANLLAPGGTLINLEMNQQWMGRYVSDRYDYQNLSVDRMKTVLQRCGCCVQIKPFSLRHLPAKLTRVGVVARKLN